MKISYMRDGQVVWPTCDDCGCRLDITEAYFARDGFMLEHFWHSYERDARGCKCPQLLQETIVYGPEFETFVWNN